MIELRPEWCERADELPAWLELGPWLAEHADRRRIDELDGDDWLPGKDVHLTRTLAIDTEDPRAEGVGIAARWYCESGNSAGVHQDGPTPLPSTAERLTLRIPAGLLASEVELQTSVIAMGLEPAPAGGIIWSDAWTRHPQREAHPRRLVIEGDEFRFSVMIAPARDFPDRASGAPWWVRLDPTLEPGDHASAAVTVLLSERLVERVDGNASNLSKPVLQSIRIGVLRTLCQRLLVDDPPELPEYSGSVGEIVLGAADRVAGSWVAAQNLLRDEPGTFDAALWSEFGEAVH